MDDNLLYTSATGDVASLTVRGGYEEEGFKWNVLDSTTATACDDAVDYCNNPTLLEDVRETDEYGNFLTMEPARDPGWYQAEHHTDGFIPLGPIIGVALPWYRHLHHKVPITECVEEQVERAAASKAQMRRSFDDLWDIVFALSEHPLYDNKHTRRPTEFDVSLLDTFFASDEDAQVVAAQARRSALRIVWWISWFANAVPDWVSHVNSVTHDYIAKLHLSRTPKRGFLIKINRDWNSLDFKFLVGNNVPLLYIWGLFESNERRFRRLTPSLIVAYHEEVARFLELKGFYSTRKEDPFPDPNQVGFQVAVIDREGWERRLVPKAADWCSYPKLYHYCVVKDNIKKLTTVVFWRFRPRIAIPAEPLAPDEIEVDYEEDVEEENRSVIHERYKGRCAPKVGQIFDPMTGIERHSAYKGDDKLERFEDEIQVVARATAFGAGSLRHRLGLPNTGWSVDLSADGQYEKRPPSRAGSDTRSERRREDSVQPMGFQSEWAHLVANSASTQNYKLVHERKFMEFDPARRELAKRAETDRSKDRRRSRSLPFHTARLSPTSHTSSVVLEEAPQRIALPITVEYKLRWNQEEIDDMRGAWLRNFHIFGAGLSFTEDLWQVNPSFIWNMGYLMDGHLMLSKSSEVRLRYWALMDPDIEYPRHLLRKAIEHGVPFRIGLTSAAAARYRPQLWEHENNAVMKRVVEPTSKAARIPHGLGPVELFSAYSELLDAVLHKPNAREVIARGGGASWIACYFGYQHLVREFMSGPSVQVTVHRGGGNDSGDLYPKDVSWDELSERDLNIIFGYVVGDKPTDDAWIFPMDDTLQELCEHFHYEWNPFCVATFKFLAEELVAGRGKARTRKDWREFLNQEIMVAALPKVGGSVSLRVVGIYLFTPTTIITSELNESPEAPECSAGASLGETTLLGREIVALG
ncbi:hypothetical protein C8J57DRAFT_1250767 [Mycena rebaudengoi]|nr:hypothetical protein C8J57DRAFT_1250767 [Mycena rebaudengoi]